MATTENTGITMDKEIVYNFCRILKETNRIPQVIQILTKMRENGLPGSHKIDFIFKLMTSCQLFPDTAAFEDAKCDAKSEEFRKMGNTYFTTVPPKYVEAIVMYNKSMCYAVSREKISISLANRSATFFYMSLYRECLETIRLAREFGLPEKLVKKLQQREVMCHEKLIISPPMEVFVPDIELPVNEKIPFIAKCLALRVNNTFGRHIIALEDIPAGTVIAKEEQFCKAIADSDKYKRCITCALEVPELLIPCEYCTQVMFCSKECKMEAMDNFHAIECPIAGALFKMFDLDHLFVFRSVIKAFLAFPDIETMKKALKRMDEEKRTIFNIDWSQDISPEDIYTPFYTLYNGEDGKQSEVSNAGTYSVACLMFQILKTTCPSFCQRYLMAKGAEDILKNIILRHLHILHSNGRTYSDVLASGSNKNKEIMLSGFFSLINNSCASNTMILSMGTKLGMMTIKNVAAGEQIFDYYAFNHNFVPKPRRQQVYLEKYDFVCQCVACVENYPEIFELPKPKDIPVLKEMPMVYFATVRKTFNEAVEYIRKYGHHYPIQQLVFPEVEILYSMRFLMGNLPLASREMISKQKLMSFVPK